MSCMCLLGYSLVLGKVNARDVIIEPRHRMFFPCDPDIIKCYYCNSFNDILLEYFGEHQVGNVLLIGLRNAEMV